MYLVEAKIGTEWIKVRMDRLSTARQFARMARVWVIVYVDCAAVGQIDPQGNWFDLRPSTELDYDGRPLPEEQEFWQLATV